MRHKVALVLAALTGLAMVATLVTMTSRPDLSARSAARRSPLRPGDLLREVNLADFLRMVLNEFGLIAASVRVAMDSASLAAIALAFALALLRLALLALVVVVFGAGIALVMASRSILDLIRRQT